MARARATATRRRRPAVRRNRRRITIKRVWKPLLLVILAIGICIGIYYAASDPSLRISKINVVGTHLVKAKEIESDVWYVLKNERGLITKHHSILFFPKRRTVAYICRRPEITSATIGRVLPHTLVVNVAERQAVVIATDGNSRWLADSKGYLFHKASGTKILVPIVVLPEGSITEDGKCNAKKALQSALTCLQACREHKIETNKISVDREGNVCFNISDGFYAKLGPPVDIQAKVGTVAKMLEREPDIGERVIYIDVSCKEFPVVRPKSG